MVGKGKPDLQNFGAQRRTQVCAVCTSRNKKVEGVQRQCSAKLGLPSLSPENRQCFLCRGHELYLGLAIVPIMLRACRVSQNFASIPVTFHLLGVRDCWRWETPCPLWDADRPAGLGKSGACFLRKGPYSDGWRFLLLQIIELY